MQPKFQLSAWLVKMVAIICKLEKHHYMLDTYGFSVSDISIGVLSMIHQSTNSVFLAKLGRGLLKYCLWARPAAE